MRPMTTDHMLNFTYEKSSDEIKTKANEKIKCLKQKVIEREERIKKIKEENGIDAEAWASILEQQKRQSDARQFSYSSKMSITMADSGKTEIVEEPRTIAAGTINNLLTEGDYIAEEKNQIEKLSIIFRNLRDLPDPTTTSGEKPLRGHKLTHQELVYLGF